MSRAVVLLLAFCALAPVRLPAQDTILPVTIDSGKMVRMQTTHSVVIGRLTARYQRPDAILHYCRYPGPPCLGAEDSAAVRTMPVATVLRLEVSQGSAWRRGAVIGGVLGAVTGGFMTAFLLSFRECTRCGSKTPIIVAGAISNGLFWGGLAALWGSAFPRWSKESPLGPARPALGRFRKAAASPVAAFLPYQNLEDAVPCDAPTCGVTTSCR